MASVILRKTSLQFFFLETSVNSDARKGKKKMTLPPFFSFKFHLSLRYYSEVFEKPSLYFFNIEQVANQFSLVK